MKALSQRGGRLRTMICGPKASGKSTFSRYLLNHLLSPIPQTKESAARRNNGDDDDGVAFLDLDPGQPEFSPMGQVYLAHLRGPFFGPPFTHPSLDGSPVGKTIRAHYIGATSPKDDVNHYTQSVMDLLEHYKALLMKYPQCPLIVNYPGWIFGQGLEMATWLISSLGLSDVVYMSEKGPPEVVEPLGQAAQMAKVPLTTLPSQPVDLANRSSAQLRTMQIQSYFHQTHPAEIRNPLWMDTPMSRMKSITVDYTGPHTGIMGILLSGVHIPPVMLREAIDGAIVGVVAIESTKAVFKFGFHEVYNEPDEEGNIMDMDDARTRLRLNTEKIELGAVKRTAEDLPFLTLGLGSLTLDPRESYSLGLAMVRKIDVDRGQIELVTPIMGSKIAEAIRQGHGIILVRGQLDNPNWAISEEYYAARTAERQYAKERKKGKEKKEEEEEEEAGERGQLNWERLREATRQSAKKTGWMKVEEEGERRRREREVWKLRKKAYREASESE